MIQYTCSTTNNNRLFFLVSSIARTVATYTDVPDIHRGAKSPAHVRAAMERHDSTSRQLTGTVSLASKALIV